MERWANNQSTQQWEWCLPRKKSKEHNPTCYYTLIINPPFHSEILYFLFQYSFLTTMCNFFEEKKSRQMLWTTDQTTCCYLVYCYLFNLVLKASQSYSPLECQKIMNRVDSSLLPKKKPLSSKGLILNKNPLKKESQTTCTVREGKNILFMK